MKRFLMSMLCGMVAVAATAQSYKEITSEALVNPSFELSAQGTNFTEPISKTVTELYGWTVPTPQEQSIANETSTEIGFTNEVGGVTASDGNFFFWNRKGWGSASGTLSTTTNTLEAGKYYVVFDYKAADYSNNNNHSQSGTTMQLTVTTESGTTLVSTAAAKRSYQFVNNSSNPGANTYMKDSPWVQMGAMFTMTSSGKAVINVIENLKNNGRSDICFDNFRLFRIYDNGSTGDSSLPIDITGMIANPSFEAGAGGNDWQKYSYNGWTEAKTDGDIKATSEENYTNVFGSDLDGLRIFNAWDGSTSNSKKLSQTINGIPTGKYRLTATVTGYTGESFSLFAGSNNQSVTVANGDAVQKVSLDFTNGKTSIDIGIDSKVFFKVDNFRLEYLGYDEEIPEEESDQVRTDVKVTTAIDYTISSTEPFSTTGSVDLRNDHATLVFTSIRPSVVIENWLPFVKIFGSSASNGSNCQVRMYNNGTIILPYGDDCHPLTVYSSANEGGYSSDDFGLENTGGYMNTMSEAQLNNRVESFRLKRGYMVTFALGEEGRGYSRCFIADKSDLVMNLPDLMANRVSSYRVFKWNSASKKGLASTTDKSLVNKINGVWCYGWGLGWDMGPDIECVPNHLYEDWPTSAACGGVTWSPHLKTNNEPLNGADDHPQDLDKILSNWQNLMRTGLRLCSPSSWDGSPNFMKQFLDAIDARGWRCDIVDLHCYWTENRFYELSGLHSQYKRPLWLSEFMWGASWNGDGVFSSKSYQDNRTVMGRILDRLNSWGYVERYAYWNQEAWYSRLVNTDDGWVEPLGQYYRDMDTGFGYNENNEFIPTTPPMGDPSNLTGTFDPNTGKVTLTWHEVNGELNQQMTVEKFNGNSWLTEYNVSDLADGESDYTCELEAAVGDQFRIHVTDFNGKSRLTGTYTIPFTVSEEGHPGMAINIKGTTYYLGGNLITNGDFLYGLTGWMNGAKSSASSPYFKANAVAGVENGAYLQAYTHKGRDDAGSLMRSVSISKDAQYYFSVYSKNNPGGYQMASVSADGTTETELVNNLKETADWTLDGTVFESGSNQNFLLRYRWLGEKAQFDRFFLAKLFTTKDEAIADAVARVKDEISVFMSWNTTHPALNTELQRIMNRTKGSDEAALETLQQALAASYIGIGDADATASLLLYARDMAQYRLNGIEQLEGVIASAEGANTAAAYATARKDLQKAFEDYLPMRNNTEMIQSPTFAGNADGWIQNGSFGGGEQKPITWNNFTCWYAWWDVSSSQADSKTLSVGQTLNDLPAGFYSVTAEATTNHNCLSDQHVYFSFGEGEAARTVNSPKLLYERADIPDVKTDDIWQTLRTSPMFVEEGQRVTFGFASSKDGANEGAFGSDNREGSWYATNFQLYYTPAWQLVATPDVLKTICLPIEANLPEGVKVYELLGRTADKTQVVLVECQSMTAGRPYIFVSSVEKLTLLHNGNLADESTVGACGLTGCFTAPEEPLADKAFVLVDGTWYKVAKLAENGIEDFRLAGYSAYIADFDQLPEVNADGLVTMPVVGGEDEPEEDPEDPEEPDGICTLTGKSGNHGQPLFDLQGRRFVKSAAGGNAKLKKGIYIRKGRKAAVK